MNNDAPDEIMTLREVAKLCRVHRSTVWRWVRAFKIASVGLGRRSIRFHRSEVERLLREGLK